MKRRGRGGYAAAERHGEAERRGAAARVGELDGIGLRGVRGALKRR